MMSKLRAATMLATGVVGFRSSCFSFYALDLGAELAQFLIQIFVTAVNVINAADFGDALGLKSSEHQRRRYVQMAGHHRHGDETGHYVEHGSCSLQVAN